MTFPRMAVHQRGWALVERDDRVSYRLHGGPQDGGVPHVLVHFTVERALRMPDGIWGAVATGRLVRGYLASQPPEGLVGLDARTAAAAELRDMVARRRQVPIGGELTVHWPGWRRMPVPAG